MKKELLLIVLIALIVIISGCTQEMTDDELTDAMGNMSDEEFDFVFADDEALAGQAGAMFGPEKETIIKDIRNSLKKMGLTDEQAIGLNVCVKKCQLISNRKDCITNCLHKVTSSSSEINLYDDKCKGPYIIEAPSDFVPDITHEEDLIISGTDTMIIENQNYLQLGNVYINDQAKLIVRNSQFAVGRGDVSTVHVYIFVSEDASLEINNSQVYPPPGGTESGLLSVFNKGKTTIFNSPTSIHYFDMFKGSKLTMNNSTMVFRIGGLLQIVAGESDTKLINSTIGAIGLGVPENAHLNIKGLKSGTYFDLWDVHEMIPEANYNLIVEKSCILKDDFTGEYKHGPYERGWQFFLDPNSHVRIKNSELRKAFMHLNNEEANFENLKIGKLSSLNYRDIVLDNVMMMGQWPFTISDANVTITNSDYLFLQPSGNSNINLINSQIVEFIPRNFLGTITFENGSWITAGEIIGGEEYHSMENDFIIKGSLQISPELKVNLQWKDAQVTREYDVIVMDESDNPIEGALIEINGETSVSDLDGKGKFELIFNEFNYNEPIKLEVFDGENLMGEKEIDFFTKTPIIIGGTNEPTENSENCYFYIALQCSSYQINSDNFVMNIKNTGSDLVINQISQYFTDVIAGQGADCPVSSGLNIPINQNEEREITINCPILSRYVGNTVNMYVELTGTQEGEDISISGRINGVVS